MTLPFGDALTYGSIIDRLSVVRFLIDMDTVTLSPKYQVVIPKRIREQLGLSPGQKIQALVVEGRIELIPVRPARELRGFLKGIDTRVERETDRA